MQNQQITYLSTQMRSEVKFRKWKVKDRRKFIASFKDDELNEDTATQALVYDCLENPNTVLNPDEFRYLITQIRIATIGDEVDFNFTCEGCEKDFETTMQLSNIIRPDFSPYKTVAINGENITFEEVRNPEYYKEHTKDLDESELYFVDFLFHIAKIGDNEGFTFDELQDYFENMSTDDFDKILDEWDKIKFKVNDLNTVECPHCNHKQEYIFDDIPNFFPSSWFKR